MQNKMMPRGRERPYEHFHRLYIGFQNNLTSSDLWSRYTSDVIGMQLGVPRGGAISKKSWKEKIRLYANDDGHSWWTLRDGDAMIPRV